MRPWTLRFADARVEEAYARGQFAKARVPMVALTMVISVLHISLTVVDAPNRMLHTVQGLWAMAASATSCLCHTPSSSMRQLCEYAAFATCICYAFTSALPNSFPAWAAACYSIILVVVSSFSRCYLVAPWSVFCSGRCCSFFTHGSILLASAAASSILLGEALGHMIEQHVRLDHLDAIASHAPRALTLPSTAHRHRP